MLGQAPAGRYQARCQRAASSPTPGAASCVEVSCVIVRMTNKGAKVLLSYEARCGAAATGAAECDSPVAVLVCVALALLISVVGSASASRRPRRM